MGSLRVMIKLVSGCHPVTTGSSFTEFAIEDEYLDEDRVRDLGFAPAPIELRVKSDLLTSSGQSLMDDHHTEKAKLGILMNPGAQVTRDVI